MSKKQHAQRIAGHLADLRRPGTRVDLSISGRDGTTSTAELPERAVELLAEILDELSQGHDVALITERADLTTQEAAALLEVSRPHVVSLLENGEIPFHKVGTHRRVRLQDVLAYRLERDSARRKALDELAAHDQSLGID